jgi:hypothetical protein
VLRQLIADSLVKTCSGNDLEQSIDLFWYGGRNPTLILIPLNARKKRLAVLFVQGRLHERALFQQEDGPRSSVLPSLSLCGTKKALVQNKTLP